jgi:hypothetical protein
MAKTTIRQIGRHDCKGDDGSECVVIEYQRYSIWEPRSGPRQEKPTVKEYRLSTGAASSTGSAMRRFRSSPTTRSFGRSDTGCAVHINERMGHRGTVRGLNGFLFTALAGLEGPLAPSRRMRADREMLLLATAPSAGALPVCPRVSPRLAGLRAGRVAGLRAFSLVR